MDVMYPWTVYGFLPHTRPCLSEKQFCPEAIEGRRIIVFRTTLSDCQFPPMMISKPLLIRNEVVTSDGSWRLAFSRACGRRLWVQRRWIHQNHSPKNLPVNVPCRPGFSAKSLLIAEASLPEQPAHFHPGNFFSKVHSILLRCCRSSQTGCCSPLKTQAVLPGL